MLEQQLVAEVSTGTDTADFNPSAMSSLHNNQLGTIPLKKFPAEDDECIICVFEKKKINEDGGGAAQTETNPSNSRLSAAVRRAFCSLERAMAPRMLLT